MEMLILSVYLLFGFIENNNGELKEYCQWDSFNATCPQNSKIIVMTRARYGRVALGKCVVKNYGYVGCTVEVLHYFDRLCSGKRHCKIPIPDEELKSRNPCPKDLASYLEADYECIEAETGGYQQCHSTQGINVSGASGYLSSLITAETTIGSESCPWIITVDLGQRINITLYDFSLPDPFGSPNDVSRISNKQRAFCHRYAIIREKATTRETVVCGGYERIQNAYLSGSNTLEISLTRYTSPKKATYFLLKYEALGCPVLVPPADGWLEQEGADMVIGCNKTRERWYLRCDGKRWVGDMRNCSINIASLDSMWTMLGDDWSSPIGILIVTALGVALGLVIGVIMLTGVLFCLKRRRNLCGRAQAMYPETIYESDEERDGYTTPYIKSHVQASVDSVEMISLNQEGYGAMWKVRPPSYSPASTCNPIQTSIGGCESMHSNTLGRTICSAQPATLYVQTSIPMKESTFVHKIDTSNSFQHTNCVGESPKLKLKNTILFNVPDIQRNVTNSF